jgi:stage V sporulation protein D (sporulation-specific penicillin-binding protein)
LAKPSIVIKKRMLFLLLAFTVAIMVLIIRLAWLQIINGDWYQKAAFEQQTQDRIINPKRGLILDTNGKELAQSGSVETISVNPQVMRKLKEDPNNIAQKLSEMLKKDKDEILKKLNKQSRYEWIAKKIDKDLGDQVRGWVNAENIKCINIDEDTKRFYPNNNLAAHVIGFTDVDNKGIYGIEQVMDQYLKGVPGKILTEVDASGLDVPGKEETRIPPKDGMNVVLTIDETIQYFTQRALEDAVHENKVLNGATAIVMNPNNGEILALVSSPDFDLNNPRGAPLGIDPKTWKGTTQAEIDMLSKTVWRNKAVTDTYEPGSTFKAITSAAGLEEKVITPDSPVNDFTVKVGGWSINCWKPNAHGNETFRYGVYHSCNPVFVRVAQSLGVDKFFKYVKAFGFNNTTGIELPGEAKSIMFKKPAEIDMAVSSFGQGFQITPIQLITAYGAIANGGSLIEPHIVKEVTDQDGNIVKEFQPKVVGNVISKQTSATLRNILEGVVSDPVGTGGYAYVKGYQVAGKTGTSQTVVNGRRSTERYIASFSSFAPADNPAICVLVVLDYPSASKASGGFMAGPAAAKIIEETLPYLGIEKQYSEEDKKKLAEDIEIPEVRNITVGEAAKVLKEKGLEYKIMGDSGSPDVKVVEQTPKPKAMVQEKSVVILYTYKPDKDIMVKVPDLRNKTVSEATKSLNDIGLNIEVTGMGIVVSQDIESGKAVSGGSSIDVQCRLETDDSD